MDSRRDPQALHVISHLECRRTLDETAGSTRLLLGSPLLVLSGVVVKGFVTKENHVDKAVALTDSTAIENR